MSLLANRKWQFFSGALALALIGTLVTGTILLKRANLLLLGRSDDHSHGPTKYFCAMHPSVASDEPGKCPICGMDLQPVGETGEQANSGPRASAQKKPLFYRHPMRSEVSSPVPAKDEMGMDYIPVFDDEPSDKSEISVAGRSSFSLSKHRQQLIGVTTTRAEKRPLSLEIRASGKVAFDPELFATIEEYRQAVMSSSQMENSTFGQLKQQSEELIDAAQTKLRLLGLTDSQIRKLALSKKSATDLILPKGNVWVYAEIFEYEVANVKVGQTMEVLVPALPAATFSGKVTSISPILNPQTRTVRVRALIPDPQGRLRPDTFVNGKIKLDLGIKLAVPNDSIMHSGEQTFVFVMKEKGLFEPRPVALGAITDDFTEVISGIEVGETVVTSANFMIDSESRLRAAVRSAQPTGKEP